MSVRGLRWPSVRANLVVAAAIATALVHPVRGDEFAAPLPANVRAVWALEKAFRDKTPTRERICLNGLWRWQPVHDVGPKLEPPKGSWGYFKVPGCWPGITDYMQKDCQTLFTTSKLEQRTPWRTSTLPGTSGAGAYQTTGPAVASRWPPIT